MSFPKLVSFNAYFHYYLINFLTFAQTFFYCTLAEKPGVARGKKSTCQKLT